MYQRDDKLAAAGRTRRRTRLEKAESKLSKIKSERMFAQKMKSEMANYKRRKIVIFGRMAALVDFLGCKDSVNSFIRKNILSMTDVHAMLEDLELRKNKLKNLH